MTHFLHIGVKHWLVVIVFVMLAVVVGGAGASQTAVMDSTTDFGWRYGNASLFDRLVEHPWLYIVRLLLHSRGCTIL
jgi:hypothetical protein